jgi:hypothetical protein
VVELIQSIFTDIKEKKQLSGFTVAKRIKKDGWRHLADAVILEPNFAGVGLNLRKLFQSR